MKNYVIIGNSAAGIAAAEEIRKLDPDSGIVIVSDEKGTAYSRCLLPFYISGQINMEIVTFRDTGFYSRNNIKLLDGRKAAGINRKERKIILDNNDRIPYHKLIIATGASAKIPPVARKAQAGVFVLRTVDDAEKIIALLESVKSAAVLGAGLIGIKIAHALYKKGKKVYVVARSNHILSQMIDKGSAEFLGKIVAEKIALLTGLDADKICYDNNRVSGLLLSNNEKIECQLVIIAKGVVSNTRLAKDAGLTINQGILVDETMKTDDSHIYAAGDVAESVDLLTGERDIKALWTTAIEQGRIAGKNTAGEQAVYGGAVSMNSVECFGIPCISSGNLRVDYPEVYCFRSNNPPALRRIFVKDNRIYGFVTIGNIKFAGMLNYLLKEKRNISEIKEKFNSAKLTRPDLLKCMDKKEVRSSMEKKAVIQN